MLLAAGAGTAAAAAVVRASLRELKKSRARIASSADRERQRIERDLHDGAQQSLVALRIRLDLAGELLGESPDGAAQVLSELGCEVDGALEQVRSLARGVYPSVLSDRGLREALCAAALRSPVRTTVDTDGVGSGRYSPEIESAVYFCCLEAMQNAMKHAGGVKTIAVVLAQQGDLRFEVDSLRRRLRLLLRSFELGDQPFQFVDRFFKVDGAEHRWILVACSVFRVP